MKIQADSQLKPLQQVAAPAKQRAEAEKVAHQFEEYFVRSLVANLRQTSSLGGEDESGMFGSGPGADTYTSWFDEQMAKNVSAGNGIGVAEVLLRDMERHGQIPAAAEVQKATADQGAARLRMSTFRATQGGFDVTG